MSCEFSFEREFSFESKLLLRDRPLLGSSVLILSGWGKGENIDHMLDKERVLQTGVIKASNTEGFSAQRKHRGFSVEHSVHVELFRFNTWKRVSRESNLVASSTALILSPAHALPRASEVFPGSMIEENCILGLNQFLGGTSTEVILSVASVSVCY